VKRDPARQRLPKLWHTLSALVTLLALVLGGCRGALKPLDPGEGEADEEGRLGTPILVRMAVSWSALPLAEELIAAYAQVAPGSSVDMMPSSSEVGEGLVRAGRTDLAIVEQAPGAEEITTSAEGKERKATGPTTLALNAIGVIVHKDSPLSQLSSADLANLFLGYYLDWEELGAGQGHIEIVSQGAHTMARKLFEEKILKGQPTSSAAIVMPHDHGVLEYVAQHQGAIGYLSASYVDGRVKLLAIDGVLPQAAEVAQGHYPLAHPLVLLVAPHAQPEALRLAAFASSTKGRQAIAKRYALPR